MKLKALIAISIIGSMAIILPSFVSKSETQQAHQTMIITALKTGKDISVAISENGGSYREQSMKTDKGDGDLGPLIMYIDQQYLKGWKLHSSNMDGGYYYFLLEK